MEQLFNKIAQWSRINYQNWHTLNLSQADCRSQFKKSILLWKLDLNIQMCQLTEWHTGNCKYILFWQALAEQVSEEVPFEEQEEVQEPTEEEIPLPRQKPPQQI